MSDFYDLNSASGCREFLSVLMDNYVPTQLGDFPIGFVDQAIRRFKEQWVPLQDITGNSLYMECTRILNEALKENLKDELEGSIKYAYDLNDKEREAYAWALENIEDGSWEIITCYANGTMDSDLYLNELNDEQIFVLQSVERRSGIIHQTLDILNTDVKDIETIYEPKRYEPELSIADMVKKHMKSFDPEQVIAEGNQELVDKILAENDLIRKQIRIDHMEGEPHYDGRQGIVESIDDAGQLHGSWGGLAVLSADQFTVIGEKFKLFDDVEKNKDFFEKGKDEFLTTYKDMTENEYDVMVDSLNKEEAEAYENQQFPPDSREEKENINKDRNER